MAAPNRRLCTPRLNLFLNCHSGIPLLPMAAAWDPWGASTLALLLLERITRPMSTWAKHRIRQPPSRSPPMFLRRPLPIMSVCPVLSSHHLRHPPPYPRRLASLSSRARRRSCRVRSCRLSSCRLRLITRPRLKWILVIVRVARDPPPAVLHLRRPLFLPLPPLPPLPLSQIRLKLPVFLKLTCVLWRTRSLCV